MARKRTSRQHRKPSHSGRVGRKPYKRIIRSGFVIKKPRRISDARLERGLGVLSETKDIKTAARAIRVTPETFKRAAKRKRAIRKLNGRWNVVRRLSRRMPIFTNGKHLAITVGSKPASLIGRYMSAVGQFLNTGKRSVLSEFIARGVKDNGGKIHIFETQPNVLYRLSSAGGEPFEAVYRIVL